MMWPNIYSEAGKTVDLVDENQHSLLMLLCWWFNLKHIDIFLPILEETKGEVVHVSPSRCSGGVFSLWGSKMNINTNDLMKMILKM